MQPGKDTRVLFIDTGIHSAYAMTSPVQPGVMTIHNMQHVLVVCIAI